MKKRIFSVKSNKNWYFSCNYSLFSCLIWLVNKIHMNNGWLCTSKLVHYELRISEQKWGIIIELFYHLISACKWRKRATQVITLNSLLSFILTSHFLTSPSLGRPNKATSFSWRDRLDFGESGSSPPFSEKRKKRKFNIFHEMNILQNYAGCLECRLMMKIYFSNKSSISHVIPYNKYTQEVGIVIKLTLFPNRFTKFHIEYSIFLVAFIVDYLKFNSFSEEGNEEWRISEYSTLNAKKKFFFHHNYRWLMQE